LASAQVSQNAVLARKADNDEEDAPDLLPVVPSVFGNKPAAHPEDVQTAIATLAACFPQQPSLFWVIATKQVTQKCLSKERLEYIVEKITLNHKYPTITLADIFAVDKSIKTLSYEEVAALKVPHSPLAQIYFNGKYYIVYADDAEKCGYSFTPYESIAEREERERKERDERWQREYEEMVKNGEIDPNAPVDTDIAKTATGMAKDMSMKRIEEDEKKKRAIYNIRQRVIRKNQHIFSEDPENAFERIEQLINTELKKARLL
jgi:hypothetical protein